MKKSFCLLFLLLAINPFCRKAAAQYPQLDAYLDRMCEMKKYTGTLLLADKDGILYEGATGPANAAGSEMNAVNSVYQIGSVTKTFTAVLVLKAVESGKLNLQTTLDTWYPELRNADQINLLQLLSHTSGIASYTDLPSLNDWKYSAQGRDEMLARIKALPSEFEPGTAYRYSNSNYYLLGDILEKVEGKPYSALVETEIAGPLGLKNTGVMPAGKRSKLSAGLLPSTGQWLPEKSGDPSVPFAAGAMYANAYEMYIFSKALFSGKLFAEKSSLELMRTPVKGVYGLGVYKSEITGLQTIGHNGGIEGYSALWAYIPSLGMHVVSLSNSMVSDHEAIVDAALRIHGGEVVALPEARQAIMLTAASLQRLAGAYLLDQGFLLNVQASANGLSCQAMDQDPVALKASTDTSFFSEIYNLDLRFQLDSAQMKVEKVVLEQAGLSLEGEPYSLPDQMRQLDKAKLQRLIGIYELSPGFELTIALQGDKLMAQATGQSPFELMAEDETHFFATVAPIDIQFELGDDGRASALLLKQAGQVSYAERKEE